MTTLKERLTEAFMNKLKENHENSKEMIASNSASFDEMGMSHTTPGEFSQEEITDTKNLENTGSMANDTDFEGKASVEGEDNCPLHKIANEIDDVMNDLASDVVDISVKEDDYPEHEHHHHHHHPHDEIAHMEKMMQNESVLKKNILNMLKESDYAAPLDFVPDTRFNVSDVLNALKAKIGEGSEGIHVDQGQDEDGNKIFSVTQIDEKKLPNELEVVNVTLKKDGNNYKVDAKAKDFPVMK